MKTITTLFFLFFILSYGCTSLEQATYSTNTSDLIEYRSFIQPDLLRGHLEIIAHDSLEGRSPGSTGIQKAADYLAAYYQKLGLTPVGDDGSFFQYYDLSTTKIDSLIYTTYKKEGEEVIRVSHSAEIPEKSSADFTSILTGYNPAEGPVVFAGFGIDSKQVGIEHLDKTLTENAWVLIFEEVPDSLQYLYSLSDDQVDINNRINNILNQYSAKGVLLITDLPADLYRELIGGSVNFNRGFGRMQLTYLQNEMNRKLPDKNVKYVAPEMAAALLGGDHDSDIPVFKKSLAQNFNQFSSEATPYFLKYSPYYPGTIQDKNVVAFFEGADPELNEEVLVLMAHYDHLGMETGLDGEKVIYNGADDNGSGTVALLAIAGALNEAQANGLKPKRSILFLHVSAEEIGLLGSRFYSDHPVIPIEKTIASFNADMVGRTDPENIERGDFNSVYLIGGEIISSGLDSIVVAANDRSVEMRLDRKFNDLTDRNQFYRRSDHWNFGRLGVPFVFFFTGVHEDYHRPTDTADKIDYEKYHRVVQLIYASTIKTANTDIRPVMDNETFINITGQRNR